jgi:hypothetical protein
MLFKKKSACPYVQETFFYTNEFLNKFFFKFL